MVSLSGPDDAERARQEAGYQEFERDVLQRWTELCTMSKAAISMGIRAVECVGTRWKPSCSWL